MDKNSSEAGKEHRATPPVETKPTSELSAAQTLPRHCAVIGKDGPSHSQVARAAAAVGYGRELPEDYSDGTPVMVAGGIMPRWMAEVYAPRFSTVDILKSFERCVVMKTKTAIDVLKRMKYILTRRGWVQGYYAKNKRGRIVEWDSKAAVGYCLTGSRLVAETQLDAKGTYAKQLLESCVPKPFTVEMFNDAAATTKKDVVAVINCAIQKAQRAGSGKRVQPSR